MTQANDSAVKALVLMSGGLDSRLAACVLRAQGIAVTGVSFTSPFFEATKAREAAAVLGLPLLVEDFTDDILGLVEHPPHGFGSGMNPCIDCHAAMLRRAGLLMEREGYRFIATGEVLNQRPMSQTRHNLEVVAVESGYKDSIVRPLSARLLPETEPERRGWVDRSRLLALEGRSRKPQFALAAQYGLKDWPAAAGGCRLTEPNFAGRLRELKRNEGLRDLEAIRRLRMGRHFRIAPAVRLVVGRDEADDEALERAARPGVDIVLGPVDVPGPTALLPAATSEADLLCAAGICARYSHAGTEPVEIEVRAGGQTRRLRVERMAPEAVERLRIA